MGSPYNLHVYPKVHMGTVQAPADAVQAWEHPYDQSCGHHTDSCKCCRPTNVSRKTAHRPSVGTNS